MVRIRNVNLQVAQLRNSQPHSGTPRWGVDRARGPGIVLGGGTWQDKLSAKQANALIGQFALNREVHATRGDEHTGSIMVGDDVGTMRQPTFSTIPGQDPANRTKDEVIVGWVEGNKRYRSALDPRQKDRLSFTLNNSVVRNPQSLLEEAYEIAGSRGEPGQVRDARALKLQPATFTRELAKRTAALGTKGSPEVLFAGAIDKRGYVGPWSDQMQIIDTNWAKLLVRVSSDAGTVTAHLLDGDKPGQGYELTTGQMEALSGAMEEVQRFYEPNWRVFVQTPGTRGWGVR